MNEQKLEVFFSKLSNKNDDSIKLNNIINNRKEFLTLINYLSDNNKTSVDKQKEILSFIFSDLIELCLKYPDTIDEFIISTLLTYQQINKEILIKNFLKNFTKFTNLFIIINKKINFISQIRSNLIYLINTIMDFIVKNNETFNDYIDYFVYLLDCLLELAKLKSNYNPRIIIFIEDLFIKLFEDNPKINKINQQIRIKFINILKEYSNLLQNDLNFDTIFGNLYNKITKINEKNAANQLGEFNNFYLSIKNKNKTKKILPMNFFILKPNQIPCLEPEIENKFLPYYIENNIFDKNDLVKIILKKTKNTQKQVIRKLKKEGKIIDLERQKQINNINKKIKEDNKLTNQFIEQQNIEYKKMMTSNAKKRFKFKKH